MTRSGADYGLFSRSFTVAAEFRISSVPRAAYPKVAPERSADSAVRWRRNGAGRLRDCLFLGRFFGGFAIQIIARAAASLRFWFGRDTGTGFLSDAVDGWHKCSRAEAGGASFASLRRAELRLARLKPVFAIRVLPACRKTIPISDLRCRQLTTPVCRGVCERFAVVAVVRLLEPCGPQPPAAEARKRAPQAAPDISLNHCSASSAAFLRAIASQRLLRATAASRREP